MNVPKKKKIKNKPNVSWVIFTICIMLMLMLLIPKMFQRFPIFDVTNLKMSVPYTLEIYGDIFIEKNRDINILVGGYDATILENEQFCIEFLSSTKERIPVCVIENNDKLIYYTIIDYEPNEWKKEIDIILK